MTRTIAILLALLTMVGVAQAQTPIRAKVGKPLKDAQALEEQGNYKAAMAKVNEAEAVPDKTAEESKVTEEVREFVESKLSAPPSQP